MVKPVEQLRSYSAEQELTFLLILGLVLAVKNFIASKKLIKCF